MEKVIIVFDQDGEHDGEGSFWRTAFISVNEPEESTVNPRRPPRAFEAQSPDPEPASTVQTGLLMLGAHGHIVMDHPGASPFRRSNFNFCKSQPCSLHTRICIARSKSLTRRTDPLPTARSRVCRKGDPRADNGPHWGERTVSKISQCKLHYCSFSCQA